MYVYMYYKKKTIKTNMYYMYVHIIHIYIYSCLFIFVFIYSDALPANLPPCFVFKEITNLFEVQGAEPFPGTHGKMHARSTM